MTDSHTQAAPALRSLGEAEALLEELAESAARDTGVMLVACRAVLLSAPVQAAVAALMEGRDKARAETAETTRLTCMHLDNMTIATKQAEREARDATAERAALLRRIAGLEAR